MNVRPSQASALSQALSVALPALLLEACSYDWTIHRRPDAGSDSAVDDGGGEVENSGEDSSSPVADSATESTCDDLDAGTSEGCTPADARGPSLCADPEASPPCDCSAGRSGSQCEIVSTQLGALRLSAGNLWPRFSPEVLEYQVFLGIGDVELTLAASPLAGDAAKLTIDGEASVSPAPARIGNLSLFEEKDVAIRVSSPTAESTTYTLKIVRSIAQQHEVARGAEGFGGYNSTIDAFLPLSSALAFDGTVLAIGNVNAGGVSIYAHTLNIWGRYAGTSAIDSPYQAAGEISDFGSSMVFGENVFAIGAPHQSPNDTTVAGSVAIVPRDELPTGVEHTTILRAHPADWGVDWFGASLAVDADLLVVGAPAEPIQGGGRTSPSYGAVYVYRNDGATWTPVQKILTPNTAPNGLFGGRLALKGGVLAVGDTDYAISPAQRKSVGAVSIYRLSGDEFVLEDTLIEPSDTTKFFAAGVTISDTGRLAVAERRNCITSCIGSANVHVYESSNGKWTKTGTAAFPQDLLNFSPTEPGEFGSTGLAFQGKLLVVAATVEHSGLTGLTRPDARPANATNTWNGAVFFFEEHDDGWHFTARLGASEMPAGIVSHGFGRNLALAGNTLIVSSTQQSHDNDAGVMVDHGVVSAFGIDCARVPMDGGVPGC